MPEISPAYDKINALRQDAIAWKAQYLAKHTTTTAQLINQLSATIALIGNEYNRDAAIKTAAQATGENKKYFTNAVRDSIAANKVKEANADDDEDALAIKFPKYFDEENRNQMMVAGFTQVYKKGSRYTGVYFQTGRDTVVQVSNFTIKPLFHVWSPNLTDNKRLFILASPYEEATLEFEAGSTISVEKFSNVVNAKNNFMWDGNLQQLKRLMVTLGYDVERCAEVKILGWQPEGFFAYADKFISEGAIVELDQYCIGEHKEKKYFSPSQSVLYRDAREDDNSYEMLAFLRFKQSTITFKQWADLMNRAYPGNGRYGIVVVVMALMRDIILRVDGNCPHFYVWGSPGSGKSKMMESLSAFFFSPLRKFQLNSGTDFAFSRFMEVFRNCFHFLNELDDATLKPQWMQTLKGAYDNEGRERGKGVKNMTEVMKVNSMLGLAGQKLLTVDDNAFLTRCIIRNFQSLENKQIPAKQMEAYEELKRIEEKDGLNSLIREVLIFRDDFKLQFHNTFSEVFGQMRKTITEKNFKWNERVARNYCYFLATAKLAAERLSLPFTYSEMYAEVAQQINDITTTITGTDASSEFWRIISRLADEGKIVRGLHYIIDEGVQNIEVYPNRAIAFQAPVKILKLRLEVCHSMYRQAYRSDSGREGMNISSLRSYLDNREYMLGGINTQRFSGKVPGTQDIKSTVTSCTVFNYTIMEQQGYFMDYQTESTHHHTVADAQPQPASPQTDLPF